MSNLQEVENFFLIANRLAPWKHGGSSSGSFVKYSIVGASNESNQRPVTQEFNDYYNPVSANASIVNSSVHK